LSSCTLPPEEQLMKPLFLNSCLIASVILVAQATPHFGAEPRSLAEVAKAKRDIAKELFEINGKDFGGKGEFRPLWPNFEAMITWSKRWAEAEVELGEKREEKLRAVEDHTKRLDHLVKLAGAFEEGGEFSRLQVMTLKHYRLEAQTWLLKLKDQKK